MPDSSSATAHRVLQPKGWQRPRGFSNGICARGETIYVAGQVGWDDHQRFADGFVAQTRLALVNILAVLAEGGAAPEHIVRLTWYVVNMEEYVAARHAVGAVYREVMGDNYPTMSLVAVAGLVESQARVEIEATAVVPR
jgi:enamine deaminase RidA (YjgF/YER057c/UK114 family)